MEASALRAPARVRERRRAPLTLLRLRSDEQLVAAFRAGSDEAFRIIYERYQARLFAYARQMLPGSRQDAEDALQDVFVRAYRHLRSSDRPLALRPWLYRVAHNRCIDALRRPVPPSAELLEVVRPPSADPLAQVERRDDLRKLVSDVRRLPEQQRSALLMRELEGFAYGDIASALDVTVPAVKSLLVRARVGLAQAEEAREAPCAEIRDQLAIARERGVRGSGQARRHLQDCAGCRDFRRELRAVERSLAAFVPALGPVALVAKVLGLGGGSSGAAAGAAASGGAASGGAGVGAAAGSTFVAAATSKVVVVVAVAAVAASGAAVQQEMRSHPSAPAPTAPAPASAVPAQPTSTSSLPGPAARAPAAPRAARVVPSRPPRVTPAPPPARPSVRPAPAVAPAAPTPHATPPTATPTAKPTTERREGDPVALDPPVPQLVNDLTHAPGAIVAIVTHEVVAQDAAAPPAAGQPTGPAAAAPRAADPASAPVTSADPAAPPAGR